MMVTSIVLSAQTQENLCFVDRSLGVKYMNAQFLPAADLLAASYLAKICFRSPESVFVKVFRVKSKTLVAEGEYTNEKFDTPNGYFKYYYPNGNLESEGAFENGIKIGTWKRYTLDGDDRPPLFYSQERLELLSEVESLSNQ